MNVEPLIEDEMGRAGLSYLLPHDFAPGATGSTGSTNPTGLNRGVREPVFESVLQAVKDHFATYIVTMSEEDLDILTLWTVATHLCEETYTSPRLILDSPVHGSGKTTVLEHIERLGRNPVQMSTVSSPALLTRMLDAGMRTVLIDEADRSLNPNKPGIEDIIAIVNSGYKRGASRPVLVAKGNDWVAKEMSTFSPVAMAGNAPILPDDTRSRSLTVLFMPAGEDEIEETDWELLDESVRELGYRIAEAADSVRDWVRSNRPPVPKGCIGRIRERWMPLKRVAAAASPAWSQRVDNLILRDLQAARLAEEEGVHNRPAHIVLLSDIHTLFQRDGTIFIESGRLLTQLMALNPQMWSRASDYGKDITPQRISKFLVPRFGIHSSRVGSQPRGYYRQDFQRAWAALKITPPTGFQLETPAPSIKPVRSVEPVKPVAEPAPTPAASKTQPKRHETAPRQKTGSNPSRACSTCNHGFLTDAALQRGDRSCRQCLYNSNHPLPAEKEHENVH